MFIASPSPIKASAPKDPLHADSSNSPCHGVALPVEYGQQLTAGSSFELEFDVGADGENTAVHGGGSCQLAITYETADQQVCDPNNWHVVYSIHVRCPANAAGNVDKAAYCEVPRKSECVNTWKITLPKGLRSGHKIMSWTWFSTISKRGMHQDCANVNIVGGVGEDMDSFPSMYVANIGHGDICTSTPEHTNVAFPSPGKFYTTMFRTDGGDWPYATANCNLEHPHHLSYQTKTLGPSTSHSTLERTISSTLPSRSYGPPDSEALYRLAMAAIVTSPTNSQPCSTHVSLDASESATYGEDRSSTEVHETYPIPLADHRFDQGFPANSPSERTAISSPSDYTLNSCPTSKVACPRGVVVVCIGNNEYGLCHEGCAVPQALAPGTSCGVHDVTKG